MTETAAALPATPALRLSTAPGRWTVAATVLGSGMAALDATVVGIALPAIGRDFHTGIVWFAVASLLCGIAPNVGVLIAARALQGVGGALLTPGSLAILQASFAEEDRPAAIGAWSGLGGVAIALPFLGGWLIDAVSWRLVFFINLPLAVAVVAITSRHVPETKAPGPVPRLDWRGAASI